MAKTLKNYRSALSKMANADFAKAVAMAAPEFEKVTAKTSAEVFSEQGYQALQQLPTTGQGDNVTRFYNVALLVGLQFVDFVSGKDVLDRYGIIERFHMDMASYMQRNQVARIPNVNPGWLGTDGTGLKNGDSVDPWKVRKPVIKQQYYGLNWNYQNFISLQDFDLKRGWLTEGGIGDIVGQIYNMIALDRKEQEFALFFKVLSGAISSTTYPLKDTQQIELDAWGSGADGAITDDDINGMIISVKNVIESLDTTPSISILNAMGYPVDASADDHVLLVRQGLRSRFEKVFGYAFNDERLQFPIRIVAVPNFGGLVPYVGDSYIPAGEDDATEVFPVYDGLGVMIGYASTKDATEATYTVDEVSYYDPHEDVLAMLVQKGAIFELIQNPFTTEPIYNPCGMYMNTFFNQPDNGLNYNHGRNLVLFRKPTN